jgi:hypothetical protein
MGDAPNPLTGRCLCGSVSYSVAAEPLASAVCHCADCQRQTSSPFSAVVVVPRTAFQVQGATLSSFNTVGGDHGQDTERFFCSACGSPIYSLSPAGPDFAYVKAGSLDDSSWLEPSIEVWTASAQPWAPRLEQAMQFERGPAQ